MTLNIGICEDSIEQRKLHLRFVEQFLEKKNVKYKIFEFSSGEELIEDYPENLDILLLDIIMDNMTGMDVSKKIRTFDKDVEILFVTSSSEYIQEGYEVRAYRYLIKPLSYEMVEKHFDSCINEIIKKSDYIVINSKNDIIRVNVNSILYIETYKREIIIHEERNSYKVKLSMKSMEELLEGKKFFRCHTSYIVNLQKVESLSKNIVYIGDKEIPVSKHLIKVFKIALIKCLGEIVC